MALYPATQNWKQSKKGKKMRKIILSQPGCSRCKRLAEAHSSAEVIELPVNTLLAFARELKIQSLPIVVLTGEEDELDKALKC